MGRLLVGIIAFVVVGALAFGILHFVLGVVGTIIHWAIIAVVALIAARVAWAVVNRTSVRSR